MDTEAKTVCPDYCVPERNKKGKKENKKKNKKKKVRDERSGFFYRRTFRPQDGGPRFRRGGIMYQGRPGNHLFPMRWHSSC